MPAPSSKPAAGPERLPAAAAAASACVVLPGAEQLASMLWGVRMHLLHACTHSTAQHRRRCHAAGRSPRWAATPRHGLEGHTPAPAATRAIAPTWRWLERACTGRERARARCIDGILFTALPALCKQAYPCMRVRRRYSHHSLSCIHMRTCGMHALAAPACVFFCRDRHVAMFVPWCDHPSAGPTFTKGARVWHPLGRSPL